MTIIIISIHTHTLYDISFSFFVCCLFIDTDDGQSHLMFICWPSYRHTRILCRKRTKFSVCDVFLFFVSVVSPVIFFIFFFWISGINLCLLNDVLMREKKKFVPLFQRIVTFDSFPDSFDSYVVSSSSSSSSSFQTTHSIKLVWFEEFFYFPSILIDSLYTHLKFCSPKRQRHRIKKK